MKVDSSDKIVTYKYHFCSRSRTRIFGVLFFIFAFIAIVVFFFCADMVEKILSVLFAILLGLAGIGCFHEGKTVVNFSKRTLLHEIYLLNLPGFRKTHFSIEDFADVYIDQRFTESTHVGLICRSEKKLLISYFQNHQEGVPSQHAKDFAKQLSDDFKLPVKIIA